MFKLSFFAFLLSIAFSTYGQSSKDIDIAKNPVVAKCIYRLTFQPDSTDRYNIVTEKAFLLISKNLSRFQTQNSYIRDSIITSPPSSDHTLNLSSFPKTKFTYIIYKTVNEETVFDNIYAEKYKYNENIKFSWDITSESKNISGFACQKATTHYGGRLFEAWFTKEIPISEGPYKFQGLPGLIVKITDSRGYYSFELLSLSKPKTPMGIIYPVQRSTTTTKEEFTKGLKTYQANAIDIIAQHGSVYGDLETQKRLHKERIKRQNNPLELK